jgi:hypothetical protein
VHCDLLAELAQLGDSIVIERSHEQKKVGGGVTAADLRARSQRQRDRRRPSPAAIVLRSCRLPGGQDEDDDHREEREERPEDAVEQRAATLCGSGRSAKPDAEDHEAEIQKPPDP